MIIAKQVGAVKD